MDARKLQSLRNLGNECEEAADEIDRIRAEVEALREFLAGAAKTRAPKPRTLAQVGTGALHGEQQYCFEKGYREGAAAVRKAISEKVAAIAARKGEGSDAAAQRGEGQT